MERDDVTGLVEATDAGREGELIFRLVYHQAKCKKPFERLWISSMEDQAISDGFSNLKDGREYDDLYMAALCRERADWIVGMNATRLFSTLYGQTLNVGRVMTPTLAMIVQREAEIDGFRPEPIYRLSITCGGITALSERFEKKEDAEKILAILKEQKTVQVTKIDPVDKKEKAPQLYSLTALQRDANHFLGFTAQQTLDYTQSLYEKKLVTYPRTDSRFLTEDMEDMIPNLAKKMAEKFGYTKAVPVHAKQVIDNKKVSDHHAIIPTVNVADADFGELPSGEQKVLSLIAARLLSALGDPAVRYEVDVEFTCADTVFKAKSKNIREKGWRDIQDWIMGSSTDSENDKEDKSEKETLDALVDGSAARYHELMKIIKDAETKMAENKVLKTHIINYSKTRDTYIAYRKSGYSKKFYEAHRDEILLHKAAKEAFSKLPGGKIPKVKDLNEEFARLLSEKKEAYSEYKKIKKEMRDYQIAKQNVESFYAAQQSWDAEEDLKKKRQQQR